MNTPKNPAIEQQEDENKAIVAALNDQLRVTGQGGQIVYSPAFQALDETEQQQAIYAIRSFNQFSRENDPYGEHDFGSVEVGSTTVFWKIDYYDQSYTMHSPNKSDPNVTNRVMTIMLGSEY